MQIVAFAVRARTESGIPDMGPGHHPPGSLIAWLHLPNGCPGSKRAHNAAWSSLPFSDRRRWRLQYVETPELEAFFAKERLPWEDEEDGEPAAVP